MTGERDPNRWVDGTPGRLTLAAVFFILAAWVASMQGDGAPHPLATLTMGVLILCGVAILTLVFFNHRRSGPGSDSPS